MFYLPTVFFKQEFSFYLHSWGQFTSFDWPYIRHQSNFFNLFNMSKSFIVFQDLLPDSPLNLTPPMVFIQLCPPLLVLYPLIIPLLLSRKYIFLDSPAGYEIWYHPDWAKNGIVFKKKIKEQKNDIIFDEISVFMIL